MRRSLLLCVAIACGGGGSGPDAGLDASPGPDATITDSGKDASDSTLDATDADAGAVQDTGLDAEAAPQGLACGNGFCTPEQGCCVDPGGPLYFCTIEEAGSCQIGMTLLFCTTSGDCSSTQVCCLDGTTNPPIATCTTSCSAPTQAQLCQPSGLDAKNRCGDAGCGNANIDTWQLTAVYGTCGDRTGSF